MRDIVRYCLKKYAANHTALPAGDIAAEYEDRFYRYMNEADMGSERGRFTSYLNIFSGLAAYEILREKGLTQEEGIKAYDSMCAFFRKLSSVLYKGADLLLNGYEIVRRSLLDDLEGEKKICWDIEILRTTTEDLLMRSAGVCISIPVRNMDIRNSARCFARTTGMRSAY